MYDESADVAALDILLPARAVRPAPSPTKLPVAPYHVGLELDRPRTSGLLLDPQPIPSHQRAVRVAATGEWFQVGEQERVDLTTRRSLRRILAHLLKMRQRHAGQARSVRQLVAAGWPGERMLPKSGADRVYTAIRTLRRFGLEDILLTHNGGYMLHPDLEIVAV